ncbi:MAG TPA: DegT/DnrJ/EryC1/StrS family aminotransferase [Pseudolabrys sp.]|nr:DegT/DnrJ/EryC1/StrS family aminotransferase [Pseudolabrys sp.]
MNQRTAPPPIPFIDVAAQRRRLGMKIDDAIRRVTEHCQFVNGPEVLALEKDLAAFCGARHAIGVASGTDALVLVLMARGIGRGDAVVCPSFTYAATPESVALAGATPVFAEVNEATFNLDPAGIERAVAAARKAGLAPKALITVDLFGLPADYDAIMPVAQRLGLHVIDDAAQSFGADTRGRKVGTLAPVTTTSFFPAKPLGCYGDGGAVFTGDDTVADLVRSLRNHGQGADRYDNVRVGMTGRLDTIQAAVLIEKLKIFPDEIAARERIARRYNAELADIVTVPHIGNDQSSVWAQYTIRVPATRRDAFAAALRSEGIPTAMYYPAPCHRQTAYRQCPVAEGGLAVTDRLAGEVISLPMHAYLDAATQDRIIGAVRRALRRG